MSGAWLDPQTWIEISLYQGCLLTHSLRDLPMFSAQAAPDAKLRILLHLIVCLLLGAMALSRFLKSNYAYYGLGFQTPSLFAECIHFQPFPSLILPDSRILQVGTCAGREQQRKGITTRKTKKERFLTTSLVSMEFPRLDPGRLSHVSQ